MNIKLKNYLENLITILTIFSINLYTLEDKSMNQRATESNLNREEFEQLLDMYIDTIVDSMSMEDFRQYVRNDMNDFLYKCSESEVINEIKYTLDDEMLDEFITIIKGE